MKNQVKNQVKNHAKKQGTVIYISNCAIDSAGTPNSFMMQELPWLLAHFSRVLMVSYEGIAELTGTQVQGLHSIAAGGKRSALWRTWLRVPFVAEFWWELARMMRDRQFSLINMIKLLLFVVRGHKLHIWLEKLLRGYRGESVTLYAYWMSYDAYAAALSKQKHADVRFLVRGHAYDIDPARNAVNPYLMKRMIAEQADGIFLISEYAKAQYLGYMQDAVALEKLHVVGVGSSGTDIRALHEPPFFEDGRLHVVSCAAISAIKQLPVLIDALAACTDIKISWLHLGGGVGEESIRAYAKEKLGGLSHVQYDIMGNISNAQVQETYDREAFDVFINTSRMEGTPVSIMEALNAGIPVIAPSVGGIPELVDDAVGMLYAPEKGSSGAAEALRAFAAMSREQAMTMRRAVGQRWQERCRLDALLPQIFESEIAREGERVT